MIELLSRIFIKNRTSYDNPEVRTAYGMLCSIVGIFLNIVLFAVKLLAGIISKSLAVTTDAYNNLSDAASSLISLLGFKLSSKKPDSEHPFGHGRLEYVTGLIVSFLIILMGFELILSSVDSIRNPSKILQSPVALFIMAGAICVKLYMFVYNHHIAKKISSAAMDATAKDSLCDMISTSVALVSVIAAPFVDFPLDAITGLLVALFILYTGLDSAKETIDPLLGLPPSKELVKGIEEEVMKHKYIVAIHDLLVHDYGPGRLMISLHAEVPGNQDIFLLHESIDDAEIALAKKFNCEAIIHLDPIDTENERLAVLKKEAEKAAANIDAGISVHDVRIVPGLSHTNLIFDAVRPHNCKLSAEQLKKTIHDEIHAKYPDVYCVITIDNPYV